MVKESEQIQDFVPADYNPRHITGSALEGLEQSIRIFGDLSGLVFNKETGNIVCGHQRRKVVDALKIDNVTWGEEYQVDLGYQGARFQSIERDGYLTLPDGGRLHIRLVAWPLDFEKAANLAANNPYIQGDWTQDLGPLLDDVSANLGDVFDGLQLHRLYRDLEGLTLDPQVEPVPPPPKEEPLGDIETRTHTGDIWLLGPHRLMCGDSTLDEDVSRLFNGKRAARWFTDPPYGVDYDGSYRNKGRNKQKWKKIAGDENLDIIRNSIPNIKKYAVPRMTLYMCAAIMKSHFLQSMFDEYGIYYAVPIIWVKNRTPVSWFRYSPKHEIIYHAGEGAKPTGSKSVWYGPKNETTIWEISTDTPTDYLHPTQKPVALPLRAIRNSSQKGAIVGDLFGGSGSTLIACQQLERQCYMMEKQPEFCDVILTRWEQLTGQTATREGA